MTSKSHVTRGIMLALLASMMWGISGTVLQYISQNQHIPAAWFLSARTFGAGVVLMIIGAFTSRGHLFEAFKSWRLVGSLFAYAVFGLSANLLTFYMSVQTGNAASATILQYLSPLFIVVGSLIFKHEVPYRSDLIAFVVSMLGVFLAITKGNVSQLAIPLDALFWGIGSGITAAFYVTLPRPIVKAGGSPILILGWGTLISGLLFNLHQPVWVHTPLITTDLVLSMLTVIVLGTILPFCLLLISSNYAPSDVISIVDAAQPVVTFILSVVFLGLQISWVEVLGSALVVIAIYLLQRGRARSMQSSSLNSNHDVELD
ncbi:DMT family transporter [Lactobacillus sp. LC28-10]|uniref:DMT family transporter n=1 Tax=Secundilactobacillus angelensis TaxID=2722706 RepID=A0ABX1KX57_9LACO|nr:DMT family transporter [Secundilactobacillus angelensis]MCH5461575.1 DMT family transporter [Secundilactobacillus angelensis]NLR17870.1 DMT family transporter [Secundilactobacillus angelensis]